ncbi:hypothetical protein HYH02_003400 [Chlamydomonas schloesseri]|uniref:Uncharacterized protein n=1 Tax=Chlamydomonas schloesseri TaxID=2026947 RepID=A0A835WPF4_9CHLO|nr:hypothetical protein HYH02_003400 [Chlamydomonas schloesseri]|eukprot:KAG2451619.1 hypothetical protein HYH02_003400 [Chlamydomonas schloesseri]
MDLSALRERVSAMLAEPPPRDWTALPDELIVRIALVGAGLLTPDRRPDSTICGDMMSACAAWARALRPQLHHLRPCSLGEADRGRAWEQVEVLDAPLRRTTPVSGFKYLAPLHRPDGLAARFPSLTALNIAYQRLGRQGLEALLPLSGRLRHLDASGVPLRRADMGTLARFTALTCLALNGARAELDELPMPPQSLPRGSTAARLCGVLTSRVGAHFAQAWLARREVQLAVGLAEALAAMGQLQRLEVGLDAEVDMRAFVVAVNAEAAAAAGAAPAVAAAAAAAAGAAAADEMVEVGEEEGFAAAGAGAAGAAAAAAASVHQGLLIPGLPLVGLFAVFELPNLSCLHMHNQDLLNDDLVALAAQLSCLTELAFKFATMRQSPEVWSALMTRLGPALEVLDVQFDAGQTTDAPFLASLAPLQRLTRLRAASCRAPRMLLDIPLLAPGRLRRLELPGANRDFVTPALLAHVCSRVQLDVLDVTGWESWSGRQERYQLAGDLLLRDLPVVAPQLQHLVMLQVALHGHGLPNSARDFELLPVLAQMQQPQPRREPDSAAALMAVVAQRLGRGRAMAAASSSTAIQGVGWGARPESHGQKGSSVTLAPAGVAAAGGGGAGPMEVGCSQAGGVAGPEMAAASSNDSVVAGGEKPGGLGLGKIRAAIERTSRQKAAAGDEPAACEEAATGEGAVKGEPNAGAGPSTSQPAAPPPPPPLPARRLTAAWAGEVDPHDHQPFPGMRSLVVHYSKCFMRSRLKSIANVRALRELHITGMDEAQFKDTTRLGCFDGLSKLGLLTALHVHGGRHPPRSSAGARHHQPPDALDNDLMGGLDEDAVDQDAGLAQDHDPAADQADAAAAGAAGAKPPQAGPGPGGRGENHLEFLARLKGLQVLTLESVSTRGLIFQHIKQLWKLTHLSLAGSICFSPEALQLFQDAGMSNLRSLRLLDCHWEGGLDATDLLARLGAALPQLEELELGPCQRVDAARLAAALYGGLGPAVRCLRRLRLHKASLTPETVMAEPRLLAGRLHFISVLKPTPPRQPAAEHGQQLQLHPLSRAFNEPSFCMTRCGDRFLPVPGGGEAMQAMVAAWQVGGYAAGVAAFHESLRDDVAWANTAQDVHDLVRAPGWPERAWTGNAGA